MSTHDIPPITAKHAIVTDTCRANRTTEGALDEALERLRQAALVSMGKHPIGTEWQFHFIFQVERPRATGSET